MIAATLGDQVAEALHRAHRLVASAREGGDRAGYEAACSVRDRARLRYARLRVVDRAGCVHAWEVGVTTECGAIGVAVTDKGGRITCPTCEGGWDHR